MGRLGAETVFLILHEEAICSFAQMPPGHSLFRIYFAGTTSGVASLVHRGTVQDFGKLLFAVPLEALRVPSLVPLHRNLEVYKGLWGTVTVRREANPSDGSDDGFVFLIRHPGGDEVGLRVPASITTFSPKLVRDWILVKTQLSSKE